MNDRSEAPVAEDSAHRTLGEVLGDVRKLATDQERVSVENLVDTLGRASVSALVLVPALVAATPLSGIPGLSGFCGLMIALVSSQAVIGRRSLWLPDFIMRRDVSGDRLIDALDKISSVTGFLDRHTHERLELFVKGLGAKLLFALCTLAGLMMPLLELIPFSASIMASFVTLIALSVLTLDGLVAFLSFGFLLGAGGAITYFV
ncbi:exopolysaccharide biosynthesis protein [Sulfitobacter sp. HNIBRBA3233]|uniref:exopolysaccharide biosynthesis protein n=1 Tax=Sulfitobacter marinivivus TaxID=3158558 RepID=UPI0032DFF920